MTWNFFTGYNKISAGCKCCYAERMSKWLQAMGQPKYVDAFRFNTHLAELERLYSLKAAYYSE
ncbi:MAG: DUF5131 family protein [Saprospiraceae bacterium]|nr:DUF5131 family protein [Saprospiraceae bacterium]